MNLPVILMAGLMAATPIGYLTYQTLGPESAPPLAVHPAAAEDESEPASAAREAERHHAVQRIDLSFAAPWPTCPLNCRMGWSFTDGGLEFEVPEGAARIEVQAEWRALSPTARDLAVWLVTPDAECGEGCWVAVATAEGPSTLSFAYEAPAPGMYRVSAYGTGPAYVVAKQDVALDALVHFS